jgi:hypothetical protein
MVCYDYFSAPFQKYNKNFSQRRLSFLKRNHRFGSKTAINIAGQRNDRFGSEAALQPQASWLTAIHSIPAPQIKVLDFSD